MTRIFVRTWSLSLLPVLAACGLTDVLEPDVVVDAEVREFEHWVASVDLSASSFTLDDGAVVRIVQDTERQADEHGRKHDLAAVHAAIDEGLLVHAWGKGEVEQSDPLILAATLAGFEIERVVQEFEGRVRSVDLERALFVLENETTVWLAEHTEHKASESGDRHDLDAVHQALVAGLEVVAWGSGEVVDQEPLVVEALRVGFEIDEARVEDFEGAVEEVFLEHDKFQLADGTYVRVTERTQLLAESGLAITLPAMKLAVAAGLEVRAWGLGEVEHEDPLVLEALRLSVAIGVEQPPIDPPVDPDLDEFEGRVDWVDAGSVFLLNGIEVMISPETEIVASNDFSPASIDDLLAALEMGRLVSASGVGRVDSTDPLRIDAVRVVFEIQVVEFEGDVLSVDEGAVLLVDGTFVMLTEETVVSAADDASPSDLGGVDAAIQAGDGVRAFGSAIVSGGGEDPGEPLNIEAIDITFLLIPGS